MVCLRGLCPIEDQCLPDDFGMSFQEAVGTQLNFSTAYHPEIEDRAYEPNLGRHVAHVRDGPAKTWGGILASSRVRL